MTDVKKGLTADEVEQLTNDGMVNVSVGKQSKTCLLYTSDAADEP